MKPEYDYTGADAVIRLYAAAARLTPPASSSGTPHDDILWTAAAKPFGYLESDDGDGMRLRPDAYGIVLPAFRDVRLIPMDAASGGDGGAFDIAWRRHIDEHLPPYVASGTLNDECRYCRLIRIFEDAEFRQQGIDWFGQQRPLHPPPAAAAVAAARGGTLMRLLHRCASGQAMIEFVVAILLSSDHHGCTTAVRRACMRKGVLLGQIRREAGEKAVSPRVALGVVPDYIRDWEPGSDEIRHTADDTFERGVAGDTLQAAVVNRSVADPADWSHLANARNTAIPDLHSSGQPMNALGFVHASLEEEVTLLPAMRDWIIGKESITVGAELWYPRLALEGFE